MLRGSRGGSGEGDGPTRTFGEGSRVPLTKLSIWGGVRGGGSRRLAWQPLDSHRRQALQQPDPSPLLKGASTHRGPVPYFTSSKARPERGEALGSTPWKGQRGLRTQPWRPRPMPGGSGGADGGALHKATAPYAPGRVQTLPSRGSVPLWGLRKRAASVLHALN